MVGDDVGVGACWNVANVANTSRIAEQRRTTCGMDILQFLACSFHSNDSSMASDDDS